MTDSKAPAHPAPYSAKILVELRDIVTAEAIRREHPIDVLDPFAGIGRIHELAAPAVSTVGVELEAEWAAVHPDTQQGDATRLPLLWENRFDLVVTSPCYGNRMADTYDGSRDRCTECVPGVGQHPSLDGSGGPCETCGGSGFALSKRYTYTTALGHPLTSGNAGAMQWGPAYRALHGAAYREMVRVTRPGGLIVVNISNHVRGGAVQHVVEWTCSAMFAEGLSLVEVRVVDTPRMGNGSNGKIRVEHEHIIVMRRAAA